MCNKILLILLIVTTWITLGCRSKINHTTQDSTQYVIDTNYIKQDLCECYVNNGYNRNIVNRSCYFGDGSLDFNEWWQQILSNYPDSTKEKPVVINMLLNSDEKLEKKFKQYCFEKQNISRSGPEYIKTKSTTVVSNSYESIIKEQVRAKLNAVESSILESLYKSAGVYNGSVLPSVGEQSQLSVLTINFKVDSTGIDHIFVSDTLLASNITTQVIRSILRDRWFSNNLDYLSYPLTYWNPSQLESPNE